MKFCLPGPSACCGQKKLNKPYIFFRLLSAVLFIIGDRYKFVKQKEVVIEIFKHVSIN